MRIEKKLLPKYFEMILKGTKKYELRLADWKCEVGDVLVLMEWNPKTKEYTGRQMEKEVTCISKTKDISFWPAEEVEKHGFQIIGFK
jgi:hypothetical protein